LGVAAWADWWEDAGDMIQAFGIDLVRRVTKLSRRQIEYWDQIGLISPTVARRGDRTEPALYAFADLVKLKVAAEMRKRHVLPSEMKRMLDELEREGIEDGLLTLTIVGDAETGRAFWIDPRTDTAMSWRATGQQAQTFELPLVNLRTGLETSIAALAQRRHGEVEQVRAIQGHRPIIAGTRIPTRRIAQYAEAGWDASKIMRAHPQLTREDIDAALAYEQPRRSA
jgi:uncharacterized protein (DUF433 family)